MKIVAPLFIFIFLCILRANAESVTCLGKTNDPNSTKLDFEIEILGKLDGLTQKMFYESYIQYTMPDGSHLKQGIDLNAKPRTKLDKVIYSGSIAENYLELAFSGKSLQSAVLNFPLKGMNQLSVQCEIDGSLPEKPVCTEDIDKDKVLFDIVKNSPDIDSIDTAIACGANVNKADKNGCTPLMFALDNACGDSGVMPYTSPFAKTVEVVDALINYGAFVAVADKIGETPLMKAAKNGIRDVYTSFIAAEADFDAQDKQGHTALMDAVIKGDARVVEQILDGNPDRRLKNKSGQTAFDIAKILERSDLMNLVRIPDSSITIEGKEDGTCSPLQVYAKQGQAVEFILKAGSKMFKLDSKKVGLDLMADANSQATQILIFDTKGTYSFTCGFHGANQPSQGTITIQ